MHGRLNLAFEELGALNLKNIARPIEAFALRLECPMTVRPSRSSGLLCMDTSEPLALPGKPSIAVLAFANMSGDLEQEYFSDGIADDIITELSRSRLLFVIARNSSFTYKGRAVDVRQVARELGVRYVLEGSVRRGGERVRVSAQLIDADAGIHVWAERYDRKLTDVFAVQDEITNAVTIAIEPAIADAEQRRALRKPPETLGAWEAYQHGLWHMVRFTSSGNERAREFFERAIALDPTFAPAYVKLAITWMSEPGYGIRSLPEAARIATSWAEKALEIDADDAEAQSFMAYVGILTGRGEEAWQRISIALASNPNSHSANGVKGLFLVFNGQPAEGREALLMAFRLNPHDVRSATYLNSDRDGALLRA